MTTSILGPDRLLSFPLQRGVYISLWSNSGLRSPHARLRSPGRRRSMRPLRTKPRDLRESGRSAGEVQPAPVHGAAGTSVQKPFHMWTIHLTKHLPWCHDASAGWSKDLYK